MVEHSSSGSGGRLWLLDVLVDILPFVVALLIVGLLALFRHRFSLAAAAGWFVRVGWLAVPRRAQLALNIALYGAIFMLGILLAGGVDFARWCSARRRYVWVADCCGLAGSMGAARLERRENRVEMLLPHKDTWQLAFAQQNGITAIILALNLEPIISGSVAVVSLAIVVINVLNFAARRLPTLRLPRVRVAATR